MQTNRPSYIALALLAVFALAPLSACCCSDAEIQQSTYNASMRELDEAIDASDKKAASKMKKAKKKLERRYERLPKDETARTEKLRDINADLKAELDAHEKRMEKKGAEAEKKSEQARAGWLKKHAGTWEGDTITLKISRSGSVDYKKQTGATSKSVNAPVTRVSDDDFEVGIFGVTTTFVIDEGPHKDGDSWKMTVDGEELTRN